MRRWSTTIGGQRPMVNSSRTPSHIDGYEYSYHDNDRNDSHGRSWNSTTNSDEDVLKIKDEYMDKYKSDKEEDISEKKNDERCEDKKKLYDIKNSLNGSIGQGQLYKNNYWNNEHGTYPSPQNKYRAKSYRSPSRHRHYSRSPNRRRSSSRSCSRSHTYTKSRRYDSTTGSDKDEYPTDKSISDKEEYISEKNGERCEDKKKLNDIKYYSRPTNSIGQGQLYKNKYWDNEHGIYLSPQNKYRAKSYRSPSRHRLYSRSPNRRRSPQNKYRAKSYRSPSRHRRYSRSPNRRRSPSRSCSRSYSRWRSRSHTYTKSRFYDSTTDSNKDVLKIKDEYMDKSNSDKEEDISEKNDEPCKDKKKIYDIKYYSRPTGSIGRGQLYKNNCWDNERGTYSSPQNKYCAKSYCTPSRHRCYSRSPYRRRSSSRSCSRSRSRSHTYTKSRRYSSSKQRSPKKKSRSQRSQSPNECGQSVIKSNSDDFVEKLKGSKTPGRVDCIDDDDYWIEADKKDSKDKKKSNQPDYSLEGSKTPGRPETTSKDEYWVQFLSPRKNLYSSNLDDSIVQKKSVPKVPKTTPVRNYYSIKDDDSWSNSPPNESKKVRPCKDLCSNKSKNKDSSTLYGQEWSSSGSESEKKSMSMSLVNSDKSDTPLLNTESIKPVIRYPQTPSRESKDILLEPPPPPIISVFGGLPVFNSQLLGIQKAPSPYASTTSYIQSEGAQFTAYQQEQQVSVHNSQRYQPVYQQYGTSLEQFQQYDKTSDAYNPSHSNIEPVDGYQSKILDQYNIYLNQIDTSKLPPVSDTKSSQDSIFEIQRETCNNKLFSLKKELETLRIQYATFKLENSDGCHNNDLENNRKAQDDVNGKIKGLNIILDELNTMISKNTIEESKKITTKYIKPSIDTMPHEEKTTMYKHSYSTSLSSLGGKKKSFKVQSSNEEPKSKKSFKSKEFMDNNKKKNYVAKLPQFNYIYYDSSIHWCQHCNIFPKTAKEYLRHLHNESHKSTLKKLDVVELPWHKTQIDEPTQPEKNPELPTKKVYIKGMEFLIGTSAWYCKLCDTWIGDLHCASSHIKSKRHNDLYAEHIAKDPNWEINWLTKRYRVSEKSQATTMKHDTTKEDQSNESKVIKSFLEKESRNERKIEKSRDCEQYRDGDKYKKDHSQKTTNLKRELSPVKEIYDTNNESIWDWTKPIDLSVGKSISLNECVQKTKDRVYTIKIDEHKSSPSGEQIIKKQKLEESNFPVLYEKKDESIHLSQSSKIQFSFIGKMPMFARRITKNQSSSSKDIPDYTV